MQDGACHRRRSLAAVLARPVQERVQGGPEVLAYLLLRRECGASGSRGRPGGGRHPWPRSPESLGIQARLQEDSKKCQTQLLLLRAQHSSTAERPRLDQAPPSRSADSPGASLGPGRGPTGQRLPDTHGGSLPEEGVRFVHEEEEAAKGEAGEGGGPLGATISDSRRNPNMRALQPLGPQASPLSGVPSAGVG